VIHTKLFRSFVPVAVAFAALTVHPTAADAQRRRPDRRPAVRSVVVIGGYRYPPYYFYDSFYNPWFAAQRPYGPYGYGYPMVDVTSSIRLEVTPRDAEVFVDGYAAGIVDDYDGIFQRLRLRPGGHEITLYLNGYRTNRQSIYLNPGADQKIRLALEPLASGDTAEAPPRPSERAAEAPTDDTAPDRGPRVLAPRPLPRAPQPSGDGPVESGVQNQARFGTLSIRVQPGDAEILVDGERWAGPAGQERVAIAVAEGRHHVEVRKDGFNQYAEDVLIRRGNTLTLNISLLRPDAPAR
jgi:hypothetical protein